MKARIATISILVSFLALLLISSCGPGKYVEKPNEELYGTWVNESYSGVMTTGTYMPQKSVTTPGVYTDYSLTTSPRPQFVGKEEVTGKWKDSEGNLWYKIQGSAANGTSVLKFQTLQKLSKSSTVREFVTIFLGEYNPSSYPSTIDPKNASYRIYYRAKE